MTIERTWCSDREQCIICKRRVGIIITRDGLVCPECMPLELQPSASSISRDKIQSYIRTHKVYRTCAVNVPVQPKMTVSPDRSMAITQSDDVILADELNARISDADHIDMVVSFIKMSGLNLIIDSLREFANRGRIRVITTAYMGATEYEAVDELMRLPNTEVRMELNAKETRLHAKCFIFDRDDGSGTAYVGSANISKTALTSGEEWVVKLREEDVPQVLDDLRNSYESLWRSEHIRHVTRADRADIEMALESRGGCA